MSKPKGSSSSGGKQRSSSLSGVQTNMKKFLKRTPQVVEAQATESTIAGDVKKPKRVKKEAQEETFTIDGQPFTLSPEQVKIVEYAMQGRHVFFTGAGGVGKSLTLKVVIEKMRELHGRAFVFVTASTGIAACNIGGCTLHSFAGVGLGDGTLDTLAKKVARRADSLTRWRTAKVLIVDEISMISPEFFELLDALGRRMRKGHKDDLFGGIQLIVAGDFLQLPYVEQEQEKKKDMRFLFETPTWKALFGTVRSDIQDNNITDETTCGVMVYLTRIYRQSNREFIEMLQAVRMGEPRPEHLAMLESRIGAVIDCSDGIRPTRLYPYKKDVQTENISELHKIAGVTKGITAVEKGDLRSLESLDKHCQAPKLLVLKVNAQVVLLRNLDFSAGLVNGSRGIVTDFVPGEEFQFVPVVKFSNGMTITVAPVEWKMESGAVVLCSRKQVPLALCWASSIHKSQSLSLDKVETRLANCFEYGQLYTALSRCTTLEGLSLLDFNPAKIMAQPKAVAFYKGLDSA